MEVFRGFFYIDSSLRDFVIEVEKYLSIKIDSAIVEKIFEDAVEDQVNAKNYILFTKTRSFFKSPLCIKGTVDDYEPETIWLEIGQLKARDVKHFRDFVEDSKLRRVNPDDSSAF